MALGGASASGGLVETFESYNSTAEMQAVWAPVGGPGVLDTTRNSTPGGSKSFSHTPLDGTNSPGTQHIRTFAGETTAAGAPIIFEVSVYDDGSTSGSRMFAELRDSSGAGRILGLGVHNSTDDGDGIVDTYHLRQALGAGPTDQYLDLPGTKSVGWHDFRMVITPTEIRASVDGNAERVVSFDSAGIIYSQMRLGGPSGVTSNGGVNFDDISVAVPEPTSLALLALGAGGLMRRRRA
ncbi:MAG TPA: PEP-CTERM sorting domain-containing protein [Tepidisphaeraceae bacterium]|nr:PEP-CTERM sorting domain-containing protein [Tepidisphaeraceae bacterium]